MRKERDYKTTHTTARSTPTQSVIKTKISDIKTNFNFQGQQGRTENADNRRAKRVVDERDDPLERCVRDN